MTAPYTKKPRKNEELIKVTKEREEKQKKRMHFDLL